MRYHNSARENGSERFWITVQQDGWRTMRAQCEIFDSRLFRDVTVTLDADWRPVIAFIQLSIDDSFAGATWFNFSGSRALAEGYTAADGRFSQSIELPAPADAFGTHPIHGDAWNLARLRRNGGKAISTPRLTSSAQSDGGTGPALVMLPAGHVVYDLVGAAAVTVPAGRFETTHFTMSVPSKNKVIDIWAFGDDCIPSRMTTTEGRRYELTELSGDYR